MQLFSNPYFGISYTEKVTGAASLGRLETPQYMPQLSTTFSKVKKQRLVVDFVSTCDRLSTCKHHLCSAHTQGNT